MARIGLFGGTFDPPHIGHLIMASEVKDAMQLSEVWFLPNSIPPHKQGAGFTGSEHRLNMLNAALEGNAAFKAEPIELAREGPSYTYDTVRLLKEKYPQHEFHFIIGADMIEYLPKWRDIDSLVKQVKFIGVNRPGYRTETKYPVILVDAPLVDISSTMLRRKFSEKRNTDYLLPIGVKKYIEENSLYGT
ncbi:nicotinate-nucleotide adenylyltransferase [Bacillus lacus]|uniref:Probable nicotinate-nucleotide adenylyltransferase n=1 Tax=Metabacillus lacus TaxID=1983721 RepID=A0A7X2IY94_9BACI|nr:nicotinate-nucleotide adenylyltransferase [Metabacillus lacus]MRX71338.1 nicotinate-nucleotide adenylyltransferase [Metabacillus lacus]